MAGRYFPGKQQYYQAVEAAKYSKYYCDRLSVPHTTHQKILSSKKMPQLRYRRCYT